MTQIFEAAVRGVEEADEGGPPRGIQGAATAEILGHMWRRRVGWEDEVEERRDRRRRRVAAGGVEEARGKRTRWKREGL